MSKILPKLVNLGPRSMESASREMTSATLSYAKSDNVQHSARPTQSKPALHVDNFGVYGYHRQQQRSFRSVVA